MYEGGKEIYTYFTARYSISFDFLRILHAIIIISSSVLVDFLRLFSYSLFGFLLLAEWLTQLQCQQYNGRIQNQTDRIDEHERSVETSIQCRKNAS